MPSPTTQPFIPNFSSQLNIESLIAAPLIAASKANVVMITGQTRALLENCFTKVETSRVHGPNAGTRRADGKDYDYHPIMINLTLTRGITEKVRENPGDKDSKEVDAVRTVQLVFCLPLLCLIPINNLVVDKVTVDFDLEITSVYHEETTKGLADGDPINDRKAALCGKITNKSGQADSKDDDGSARLKVNINAGPLPLPLGLLAILDLYTKSIQPVQMK